MNKVVRFLWQLGNVSLARNHKKQKTMTNQEVQNMIIELKDVEDMSFREIADFMKKGGYPISKSQANKIYKRYKEEKEKYPKTREQLIKYLTR